MHFLDCRSFLLSWHWEQAITSVPAGPEHHFAPHWCVKRFVKSMYILTVQRKKAFKLTPRIIRLFFCTLAMVSHTHTLHAVTVHLYLTGSTAALNEHTNYWTELRAIIMPDCASHTTKQGWNNYCTVVSASGEVKMNPVTWKILFWTGIICAWYSSSGMVLVSKGWNHLLYNKGAIVPPLWLCVHCAVSP